MRKAATKLAPADHGRRMSLPDFDHAEVQEGYCYERGRAVIVVSEVPNKRHLNHVVSIRDQLTAYKLAHAGRIQLIASGNECQLRIVGYQSEHHADLAVYQTLLPEEGEHFWSIRIPELVIEAVSPGSELCDYQEKRAEYLGFGVREYRILDADTREMLVLKRFAGRWRERIVRLPELYQTRLLSGLQLACEQVFQAALAAEN